MDVGDEPSERYERLPWERLVPPPQPDRRRWALVAGVGGVVAVVAFMAGAGSSAAPAPVLVAPEVSAPAPEVPPTGSDVQPLPPAGGPALPSEADLRAAPVAAPSIGVLSSGVARYLATVFEAPGVLVDRVVVHESGAGDHVAVVSLWEVVDGAYRRVPDVAIRLAARLDGDGVVIDRVVPAVVPPVGSPEPLGEVSEVPDPVMDVLVDALAPWEGAEVSRVGSDALGWWAEVGLQLPGGAVVSVVVRPVLPAGLGAGG